MKTLAWLPQSRRLVPQVDSTEYQPFDMSLSIALHSDTIRVEITYPIEVYDAEIVWLTDTSKAFPYEQRSITPGFWVTTVDERTRAMEAHVRVHKAPSTAQDMCYKAFTIDDLDEKKRLAEQAIILDCNCSDAYLLLAEQCSIAGDALQIVMIALDKARECLERYQNEQHPKNAITRKLSMSSPAHADVPIPRTPPPTTPKPRVLPSPSPTMMYSTPISSALSNAMRSPQRVALQTPNSRGPPLLLSPIASKSPARRSSVPTKTRTQQRHPTHPTYLAYERAATAAVRLLTINQQYSKAMEVMTTMIFLSPHGIVSLLSELAYVALAGNLLKEFVMIIPRVSSLSTAWLYSVALCMFKMHGDNITSRKALVRAVITNQRAAAMLLSTKQLRAILYSENVGSWFGFHDASFQDEQQASNYVKQFQWLWMRCEGAMKWLTQFVQTRGACFDLTHEMIQGLVVTMSSHPSGCSRIGCGSRASHIPCTACHRPLYCIQINKLIRFDDTIDALHKHE